jgi:tRNA dimethylallyltransferase
MLAQVDPLSLEKIHAQDQVRTLRALEVFYVTGQPISHQQGSSPPPYPILQIGLDCSADQLQPRIEQRTQTMLEQGFVAEVRQLAEKYGWNLPLLSTLGYAEIRDYLMDQISLPTAIANIILHTRQFAKRQRTWFRGDPNIHWFNATDPHLLEQVLPPILNYLAEGLETSP